MGYLSVELLFVLHPHVLGEGVVVIVELVAHDCIVGRDDVIGQDDIVADGHDWDAAANAVIAVDATRVFHFIYERPEISSK